MNKLLISLILIGFLGGCDMYTEESTANYILPDGLKDCKIYYMRNSYGNSVTVTRCPVSSSSTQYQSGKTAMSSTVVEDDKLNQEMEEQKKKEVALSKLTDDEKKLLGIR